MRQAVVQQAVVAVDAAVATVVVVHWPAPKSSAVASVASPFSVPAISSCHPHVSFADSLSRGDQSFHRRDIRDHSEADHLSGDSRPRGNPGKKMKNSLVLDQVWLFKVAKTVCLVRKIGRPPSLHGPKLCHLKGHKFF